MAEAQGEELEQHCGGGERADATLLSRSADASFLHVEKAALFLKHFWSFCSAQSRVLDTARSRKPNAHTVFIIAVEGVSRHTAAVGGLSREQVEQRTRIGQVWNHLTSKFQMGKLVL